MSPVPTTALDVIDEETPLISAALPAALDDSQTADEQPPEEDHPLPKLQLFLLCFARFVEPIAFFSIFPFVNLMVHENGVPQEEVGFWSGWIESVFSLMQTLSMLYWGRASDKYGRKPVLVLSLSGVAVSSVLFGLARSVWQMIALRSLAGIFSGTLVTVRTMVSENSTASTQARAFSFFAFAGNLGIFVGPIIGGALSKPVLQYPALFGNVKLFAWYPYLLPCIATGLFTATAMLINFIWLKETLVFDKDRKGPPKKPMSTREILSSPGVVPVLLIFEYVMMISVAFTAVLPVFLYTPVPLGGFSWSPSKISLYLASAGIGQAFWILLVFPPLQRRIGTGNIIRITAVMRPLALGTLPVLNALLRRGETTAFWVAVPCLLAFSSSVSMSFTAVQLILNDISPSPLALGTLNGIALSVSSAVRAVCPALFTSLYAAGVKYQVLDGQLGFVVLVAVAVGLWGLVRWMPEKVEGRPKVERARV